MPSEIKITFTDEQMAEIKAHVDSRLEGVKERLEAAEWLAAAVRSFRESMAFQPPEALAFMVNEKLAGPLQTYEEACSADA